MNEALVPSDIGKSIVSPFAYAAQKELMAGFRWLRHNNRIGRVEAEGFDPFWAVTTFTDIVEVSRQQDLFSSGERSTTLVSRASDDVARSLTGGSPHLVRTLLEMDGVDHERYRQIAQVRFSRQSVQRLEDRIRSLATRAVDRMGEHGDSCDFVREIALRFPLQVVMEMLGVPAEDEQLLFNLLQESRGRHPRRLVEALTAFGNYFIPLMNERRRNPCDDLTSIISIAEIDGAPIGQSEAISYHMLLVTAGFHTTAAAMSGGVWALCENAEQFSHVRNNRDLIPRLVEEATRWTTPVHHMMRTATADTEMHGRRIAKGDWLMLCYLSGNRDDGVFSEPDSFRIERESTRSLTFGHGAHACLGRYLAQLEMRILFEELFARLSSIELAGVPRRSASLFLGGPKSLPVRFRFE